MPKKRCVAMLLAGGQGSRLRVLTEQTAKPAVPFGGKYRIIDFPLSNCVNSGIDTVGILTQYQPLELNEYIGNGQPWGLNKSRCCAQILPPYARSRKSEWYRGTANAVYQNIPFLQRFHPEHVLILSGDHIYRMDYAQMLRQHAASGADCTIAVRQVPLEEASRFGILNTDESDRIVEFEEKPAQPKSTNASMGIYVFRWPVLLQALEADEAAEASEHDFGKNVIPALLQAGRYLAAYRFSGYWRDVGTVQSLWEANLDLLGEPPAFDLHGGKRILARNYALPASYVDPAARTADCLIAEGSEIYGQVEHSVVSTGCFVGRGASVRDSVLMPGVQVLPGAEVFRAICGEDAVIGPGSTVGAPGPVTVLGKGRQVLAGETVRGEENG